MDNQLFDTDDYQYNQQMNLKLQKMWMEMKHRQKYLLTQMNPLRYKHSQQIQPTHSQQTNPEHSQNKSIEFSLTHQLSEELHKNKSKLAQQIRSKQNLQQELFHQREFYQKKIMVFQLNQELQTIIKSKDQQIMFLRNSRQAHTQNMIKSQNGYKSELSNLQNINCNQDYSTFMATNKQNILQQSNINTKAQKHIQFNKCINVQFDQSKYKEDIQRLVQLLRSTTQYKQFVIENEGAGQMTFLKRMLKNKRRVCGCSEARIQTTLWCLKDAFSYIKHIKSQYNLNIPKNVIEEMLFYLNQIYNRKQQARINKIRKKYQQEIQQLTRTIDKNVSYQMSQIVKKKQRDLSRVRQRCKKN